MHQQLIFADGMTQHGERATFAITQFLEFHHAFERDRQHIALLRFVAPDLHRRHAALFAGNRAQFEFRALAATMHQLRQRIGDAPRSDVVDGEDGIVVAHLPAAVDDFLCAALHLGVAALHRIEIQIFGIGTRVHARCRAAAQADQHAGTAQLDQHCAFGQIVFVRVFRLDVANATRQHDGLVVAAHFTVHLFFESAEVACQVGTAEFVVERGAAEGAVDHDLQGSGDTPGLAVGIGFPWLFKSRNVQVGNRKPGQSRLGFGTGAGGAFVADLTAAAGGCARKRRDGCGMVMRLHLHQGVGEFSAVGVTAVFARIEAVDLGALDDGGVVGVRHHRAFRMQLVGIADHAEQRNGLLFVVNDPVGIENLVAAVLGVGLRKHHEFDVGRVALELGEVGHQIVDLIGRKRQAQVTVGDFQCGISSGEDIHAGQRLRRAMGEYPFQNAGNFGDHRFGHAVMQQGQHGFLLGIGKVPAVLVFQVIQHAAFDALHLRQCAMAGDVCSLGRPGRNGAQARHHKQRLRGTGARRLTGTLVQTEQTIQQDRFVR